VIHLRNAWRAAVALLLVGCLAAGCARSYAGPKVLAAVGAALLVGGATTWAVGERRNENGTANFGLVTTVIGVGAVIGAAGWLAASVACEEDPDCPRGEECKEIPALPGRVPYKQCMRRPGP
jgi:drug/metabolite transporter (DMT)-like permease